MENICAELITTLCSYQSAKYSKLHEAIPTRASNSDVLGGNFDRLLDEKAILVHESSKDQEITTAVYQPKCESAGFPQISSSIVAVSVWLNDFEPILAQMRSLRFGSYSQTMQKFAAM